MSVAGYLQPEANLTTLSRTAGREIGACFHGPVLRGEVTAEEKRQREAIENAGAGGERYRAVAEYDPVLRAHCRL